MIAATTVFSSVYSVIGIIMGIIGLVGLIATGWVVTRSGMVKSTIATQDSYINALQQENGFQAETIKKMEDRIKTMEDQLRLMQDLVTGKAAIEALTELVVNQHKAIMEVLSK